MLWKFSVILGALLLLALFVFHGYALANGKSPRMFGEKTLKEKLEAIEEKKKFKVFMLPCRDKSTIVTQSYGLHNNDSGIGGSSGAYIFSRGLVNPTVIQTVNTCN